MFKLVAKTKPETGIEQELTRIHNEWCLSYRAPKNLLMLFSTKAEAMLALIDVKNEVSENRYYSFSVEEVPCSS